jgi:hypothetical protein
MKKLLFVVNHSAHLKSPLTLILKLKSDEKFSPIVFLNFAGGWNLWKEVEICKKHEIAFVTDFEGALQHREGLSFRSAATSPYNDLKRQNGWSTWLLFKGFLRKNFAVVLQIRFLLSKVRELEALLKKNQIDALVVPEDSYEIHSILIKAAKNLAISSILIPFTKSNELEILDVYPIRKLSPLSMFYVRLISKWKMVHRNINIIPLPLMKIISLDVMRLSPKQPYLLMGGHSDIMLVENSEDFAYYKKAGIAEEKMLTTGAVYQDTFYEILVEYDKRKRDFFIRNKIVSSKPVILVTLFPIATPVSANYGVYNYGTVENAITFWLGPLLACSDFQIWLVHHPRTNLAFVSHLESWNLKVINEPIEVVMPFCDLHLAGTSATTRMSLALGKPIICYTDNAIFTDLSPYRGTVTVKTGPEYMEIIDKLKNEKEFFNKLHADAKENSSLFGAFDGKAYERIVNVFERYTAK